MNPFCLKIIFWKFRFIVYTNYPLKYGVTHFRKFFKKLSFVENKPFIFKTSTNETPYVKFSFQLSSN